MAIIFTAAVSLSVLRYLADNFFYATVPVGQKIINSVNFMLNYRGFQRHPWRRKKMHHGNPRGQK